MRCSIFFVNAVGAIKPRASFQRLSPLTPGGDEGFEVTVVHLPLIIAEGDERFNIADDLCNTLAH